MKLTYSELKILLLCLAEKLDDFNAFMERDEPISVLEIQVNKIARYESLKTKLAKELLCSKRSNKN